MSYKQIPFGTKEEFNVVIEISKESRNKYEYDETLDVIKLDWVFINDFKYPFNYGYIPQTRGGDGDHLDVIVLSKFPIDMGVVVPCRALGIIKLLDRGEVDDKVVAVPIADTDSSHLKELRDLPYDYKKEFETIFMEIASQKKKIMEIKDFLTAEETLQELESAHTQFKSE